MFDLFIQRVGIGACTLLLSHRSLHLTAFTATFDLFIERVGIGACTLLLLRSLHLTAIDITFDLFIEQVSIKSTPFLSSFCFNYIFFSNLANSAYQTLYLS